MTITTSTPRAATPANPSPGGIRRIRSAPLVAGSGVVFGLLSIMVRLSSGPVLSVRRGRRAYLVAEIGLDLVFDLVERLIVGVVAQVRVSAYS